MMRLRGFLAATTAAFLLMTAGASAVTRYASPASAIGSPATCASSAVGSACSLTWAIQGAPSGSAVRILPGTYSGSTFNTQIVVPIGVTVEGDDPLNPPLLSGAGQLAPSASSHLKDLRIVSTVAGTTVPINPLTGTGVTIDRTQIQNTHNAQAEP